MKRRAARLYERWEGWASDLVRATPPTCRWCGSASPRPLVLGISLLACWIQPAVPCPVAAIGAGVQARLWLAFRVHMPKGDSAGEWDSCPRRA